MADFKFEKEHKGCVIGIDEVGRGPWAGPVVAAAVMLDPCAIPEALLGQIDDSKTISKSKREQISAQLRRLQGSGCHFFLGQASVDEIDALNIRQATFLAMQRAVEGLPFLPDAALVDGPSCPRLACKTVAIIKGDTLSISIAAASIIAKVFRDRMMTELAAIHPSYGWERNVGYGTREHQQALALHGITPYHRKSFAPVRQILFSNDFKALGRRPMPEGYAPET